MAKTTTTVQKTVKGSLPYHFTCNYCGRRNDNVLEISGVAIETKRGAYHGSGSTELSMAAMDDLRNEPKRISERIDKYKEGLIKGQPYKYTFLFRDVKGDYPAYILIPHMDGICKYCGKQQVWRKDPTDCGRTKFGCLSVILGFLLGLSIMIASCFLPETFSSVVGNVIGGFGFAIIICGIILRVFLKQRHFKNHLAEIAKEPNDPANLPSLDIDN